MANPIEITFYARTGYTPSDEPASDSVIDLNEHWTSPDLIKEYDAGHLPQIKVKLTDEELHIVDYIKATDTVTKERWYYFVAGHNRHNAHVVTLMLMVDNFASIGLQSMSFFGNISRRSLSATEKANYPLLPEPWAPRRPLQIRRLIVDLNVNKSIVIPSHISTQFEEETTKIEAEETANVPNSPLGLTTFQDSLSIDTAIPMGYPNAAGDTTHAVTTPWGTISYVTPFETYYKLSGAALGTFLAKAKKYNSLDLIDTPYYVPEPPSEQSITLTELSNPNTRNPKAGRYYTTITIRSLASGATQTYSDNDTDLQYSQPLTVVIAPDKSGGIYVLPTSIRDTGLNAYTYLNGVYSPFESVTFNAVGDTPAKFAADGTTLLNSALNNLFQTYINKVNALQVEGMQSKYFKDVGVLKGAVMSFVADILGSESTSVTTTEEQVQNSVTETLIPRMVQSSTQTQATPAYTQSQSQTTATNAYQTTQTSETNVPRVTGTQTTRTTTPRHTQSQSAYSYSTSSGGETRMPAITTTINESTSSSTADTSQSSYRSTASSTTVMPVVRQTTTGSTSIPYQEITTTGSTTTPEYVQNSTQKTTIPTMTTTSHTVQQASSRGAEEGNEIAVEGVDSVYELDSWSTLKNIVFGGYRNEVHSFMLGNINDYLNRWVSIQNDMHNGKVANLFKNITLVGGYSDHNKLAGKFEVMIASLRPEDEANFDLFLDHFGHAVDEYSTTLVADVQDNYNYTMVGDDAILTNSVSQSANGAILNQFRTGVRVWKTLIRPENF